MESKNPAIYHAGHAAGQQDENIGGVDERVSTQCVVTKPVMLVGHKAPVVIYEDHQKRQATDEVDPEIASGAQPPRFADRRQNNRFGRCDHAFNC